MKYFCLSCKNFIFINSYEKLLILKYLTLTWKSYPVIDYPQILVILLKEESLMCKLYSFIGYTQQYLVFKNFSFTCKPYLIINCPQQLLVLKYFSLTCKSCILINYQQKLLVLKYFSLTCKTNLYIYNLVLFPKIYFHFYLEINLVVGIYLIFTVLSFLNNLLNTNLIVVFCIWHTECNIKNTNNKYSVNHKIYKFILLLLQHTNSYYFLLILGLVLNNKCNKEIKGDTSQCMCQKTNILNLILQSVLIVLYTENDYYFNNKKLTLKHVQCISSCAAYIITNCDNIILHLKLVTIKYLLIWLLWPP